MVPDNCVLPSLFSSRPVFIGCCLYILYKFFMVEAIFDWINNNPSWYWSNLWICYGNEIVQWQMSQLYVQLMILINSYIASLCRPTHAPWHAQCQQDKEACTNRDIRKIFVRGECAWDSLNSSIITKYWQFEANFDAFYTFGANFGSFSSNLQMFRLFPPFFPVWLKISWGGGL